MRAQLKEGLGITGMNIDLTVQDCIVLKALVEDLKSIQPHEVRRNSAMKDIEKAITFINKVSGEVMSLNETATILFDLPEQPTV